MNRLTLILAINDARDLGKQAALHNEGWHTNPYKFASEPWCTWGRAYNETIEELAVAEMAMRDGRKSDGELECDVAEPQPRGWFGQLVDSFFSTKGK